MDLLAGQTAPEIRDVLLQSVTHDPNAAVRLKALEGLRPFRSEEPIRSALVSVLQYDDNSGVRSEAIEVLAPPGTAVQLGPDLAGALEQVIRSERNDDYIRMRCFQILQMTGAPGIY